MSSLSSSVSILARRTPIYFLESSCFAFHPLHHPTILTNKLAFFCTQPNITSLSTHDSSKCILHKPFNSSIFKLQKRTFTASSLDENSIRILILESALKKVPQLGWTHEALAEGCTALGYPPTIKGLVQRGPVELVEYFLKKCDREMSDRLSQQGALDGLTPREIISKAIRLRLELSSVHIHSLPQAGALLLHPSNAPESIWKLATLIDEIWHLANDRSTNLDWYLKRGVLCGIYTSTEIYMLSDKSPNFRDTWEFLERRLDEATELANLKTKAELLGSVAVTGICSILQMATEGLRTSVGPAVSSVVNKTMSSASTDDSTAYTHATTTSTPSPPSPSTTTKTL